MTVLEVIQRSADFLARRGVESPRLNAELLLAHGLNLPRLKLYLEFSRALSDAELNLCRELVRRRAEREPLQHILGSTSFCGLEIKVGPDVLVPRPETELLAEIAWRYLNEREGPSTALDFATGSGCIAIAVCANALNAQVHATDISSAALQIARANAARLGCGERLTFHEGDGFAALPAHLRFDAIVSNPPYIPAAEIESLSPEVRDFDPRMALDGGLDGLSFYRRIAAEAPPVLKAEGRVFLEFGDEQANAIADILQQGGWRVLEKIKDFSGRERILIAQRPEG